MNEYLGPERREEIVTRQECETVKAWVKDIDEELKLHTKAEARMEERIEQIESDLKEVRDDVKSILDIISRAKGAWALLGWAAGAVGAVVAAFAWAKDHLK